MPHELHAPIRSQGQSHWRCGTLRMMLLVGAIGCADGLSPAGPPSRLTVTGGDGQWGSPGLDLSAPLGVELLDAKGRPVVGTSVSWTALDGGTITPAVSVSDADGRAAARWQLGTGSGVHHAQAVAPGLAPVTFTAGNAAASPLPLDVIEPLEVVTYEGSGQVVHPDVADLPSSWNSERLRLAITPYPNGDAAFENPSLYSGSDALTWLVPPGVANPLARSTSGHLSDPDILYDPDSRELWLYYRQVTSENEIYLVRSRDGVAWSAPALVAHVPNHGIISPSVVRRAPGDWWMWSVNGGATGCQADAAALEVRRSSDGLHWSAPTTARLSQPGVFPWHVDVEWIASLGEFWALYNVKTAGSCTTPAVYLATSTDGVRWTTFGRPVLARGASPAFADIVYRSSFEYDAAGDEVTFWFSGARYDGHGYVWHAAVERRRRADVFAQVMSGGPGAGLLIPTAAPPLVDWP